MIREQKQIITERGVETLFALFDGIPVSTNLPVDLDVLGSNLETLNSINASATIEIAEREALFLEKVASV
jgi:hypothetical protein